MERYVNPWGRRVSLQRSQFPADGNNLKRSHLGSLHMHGSLPPYGTTMGIWGRLETGRKDRYQRGLDLGDRISVSDRALFFALATSGVMRARKE